MSTICEVAVIPAAGRGTRMRPATHAVPKALLPIVDRPSVQYVVEEAIDAGAREVILVVDPEGGDLIRSHFDAVNLAARPRSQYSNRGSKQAARARPRHRLCTTVDRGPAILFMSLVNALSTLRWRRRSSVFGCTRTCTDAAVGGCPMRPHG